MRHTRWHIVPIGVIAGTALTLGASAQTPDEDSSGVAPTPATAVAGAARRDLALAVPERATPEHKPSDLFAVHSWYTPPPPPPPAPPPPPPPAPTAPPLPYTYVGSFQQDGGTVYFLSRGDRAYDVKIGDVLDGTYSVDGVSNGELMLTYLPLKTPQNLPLGESK